MHRCEAYTMKGWVARDKDGYLYWYLIKPEKSESIGWWCANGKDIPKRKFPHVKWEDKEPTRVTITIKEEK